MCFLYMFAFLYSSHSGSDCLHSFFALFIYLLGVFFSTVRVHGVANWASVHKQQALNMAGR